MGREVSAGKLYLYYSVYLSQKENEQFAIKIIDKDKIVEDKMVESLKNEILLMKMIRHPYIVKLVEVMSTSQKFILVMEYVSGGDLFDKISN